VVGVVVRNQSEIILSKVVALALGAQKLIGPMPLIIARVAHGRMNANMAKINRWRSWVKIKIRFFRKKFAIWCSEYAVLKFLI
jgi:hypothetical protein